MKIEKLIKEAHGNAKSKGFYDCPKCGGVGEGTRTIGSTPENFDFENVPCENCNGSGIDPNKNIGELLMLIVSELGEALEAHRNNRFADWYHRMKFLDYKMYPELECFERCIKNTLEDEIADVFIRLFDLCGYLNINAPTFEEVLEKHPITFYSDNVGDMLYRITQIICKIRNFEGQKTREYFIMHAVAHLWDICKTLNIPIEKHIQAKMEYNKTRPHKHNKEY